MCRDALLIHTLTEKVTYNGALTVPAIITIGAEGALVDLNRNNLVEDALRFRPDYVLFVDDDMMFPRDGLFRLMMHDKPVAGCNYRQRVVDHVIPSAFNIIDGQVARLEPKPDGLEQADVIGMGFCLMKGEVFRQLTRPWFGVGPYGEDGYFCEKLRAVGIRPYIDHALSMECWHIAETVLTFPR
jgi:hypothetical protein